MESKSSQTQNAFHTCWLQWHWGFWQLAQQQIQSISACVNPCLHVPAMHGSSNPWEISPFPGRSQLQLLPCGCGCSAGSQGMGEEVAAAKHLVPEVKRNLGEVRNQPALAQGSSWNIQALPCRSTFFFPAGKIKQNGNSWPPPLQMFGCEESLSPGITGIKPQQVVSPQLGSGSSWADALLPHSSVSCPARFWGGRKRLKSEQIKPVGQALRVPGLSGAYRVKFCSYSSSTW